MEEKQHSNEWYTPAKYIEAAREVMGAIDLDPASSFEANQTVKATRYYTQAENGLEQPWHDRIWLNPPYGMDNTLPNGRKSKVKLWLEKLVGEYHRGNVEQAITLLMSHTDQSWFQFLWEYPICFSDHCLRFFTPFGRSTKSNPAKATWKTNSHVYGTCFVYLGPYEQKFIDIFSQFGRIAKAIDTPRHVEKPIPLWDAERIYA